MSFRKGQASTFSLEQFVRIAVSVTIAAFLLIIIIALVAFFMSPSKQDATSTNVFNEFINVIEAQEGDSWEVRTFVYLPPTHAIVGYGTEQTTTLRTHQLQEFNKPRMCGDTSCVCLYKRATNGVIDSSQPVNCKPTPGSEVTGTIAGAKSPGTLVLRGKYRVLLNEDTLDISLFSEEMSSSNYQETPLSEVSECNKNIFCCTIQDDEEDKDCLGRSPGLVSHELGSDKQTHCVRTDNPGECRITRYQVCSNC